MTKEEAPALDSSSVHARVEAVRALALAGTAPDLEPLLTLALEDKSPSVRLTAASAAGDILSRVRVDARRGAVTDGVRRAILDELKVIDPILNPSIFQVYATLGIPEAVGRTLLGLRDPRVDVRSGAVIGLERLCVSSAAHGSEFIERRVVQALEDKRVPVATKVDVVMIAARMGFRSVEPVMDQLEGLVDGALFERIEQAREWFALAGTAAGLHGRWVENGLDAGEVGQPLEAPNWLILRTGVAAYGANPTSGTWSWKNGSITCALAGVKGVPVRRLVCSTGLDEYRLAIQIGDRTFRQVDDETLPDLLECLEDGGGGDRASALCDIIAAGLGTEEELADQKRESFVYGCFLLWAGRADEAFDVLGASAGRGIPKEVWWVQSRAARLAGRTEDEKTVLALYLKRAAKKAPRREVAQARLDAIS